MYIYILLISLQSFKYLSAAQAAEASIPSNINSTTFVMGNTDSMKDETFKDFLFFNRQRRAHDQSLNTNPQCFFTLTTYAKQYGRLMLNPSNFDNAAQLHPEMLLKNLYLLCMFIKLVNYRLSEPFVAMNRSLIGSFEIDDSSPVNNSENLKIELFLKQFYQSISNYQRHHNPTLLSYMFSNRLFGYFDICKFAKENSDIFQLIGECLEIVINDICLHFKYDHQTTRLNPDPFLSLLDKELRKVALYFRIFSSEENEGTRLEALQSILDKLPEHFFNPNNSNNLVHIANGKLDITIPDWLKEKYFKLYDQVTKNNTRPCTIDIKDFWADKFIITVSPIIPGIIEGYTPSHPSYIARVEKAAAQGAKAIEKDVEFLMKELGLEDEKAPIKISTQQKKPAHKNIEKPARPAAVAPIEGAQKHAEVLPLAQDTLAHFYTFNRRFAHIRIELDERILSWYQQTKKGTNRGITTQGYLEKGSSRNKILVEEMAICEGNQDHAIANIVFRHQLPYSLIRNIMSYGTIQNNFTDERTTITALVNYVENENTTQYFLGEITGKIEGGVFKIWHSFLRPITNINQFLKEHLLSFDHLDLKDADHDDTASKDQSFKVLGEEKEWHTEDQFDQVIITKDNTTYILFKN